MKILKLRLKIQREKSKDYLKNKQKKKKKECTKRIFNNVPLRKNDKLLQKLNKLKSNIARMNKT